MKVHGVVRLGTCTEAVDETLSFFRDVLGVPLGELEPGFGWSQAHPSPGDRYDRLAIPQ